MRRSRWIGAGLAITFLLALFLRPAAKGGPYRPPFEAWNRLLQHESPGAPVAILDLDALDHNAAQVQKQLGSRYQLRLSTKSIPSLPLIAHLQAQTGSRRLMVFSEVFLDELLKAEAGPVDILLGRPFPEAAAARLLDAYPSATQVRWLIDSLERATAYARLARERGGSLQVAIELDVGLHRGGVRSIDELNAILGVIEQSGGGLRPVGFMGYEGHVPHVPALFARDFAVSWAFDRSMSRYETLVRAARERLPDAFQAPQLYNSGGSRTYGLYDAQTRGPVNELALGSAFLAPSNFPELVALGHRPALYLATPVLRRLDPGETPFLDGLSRLLALWDPNLSQGFCLVGGGWTASPVEPPGLTSNFLLESGGGIESLLSNQRLLFGSNALPLRVDDFVFFQPWEGDALVTFESVLVIRQGKVVDRWSTFRRGS